MSRFINALLQAILRIVLMAFGLIFVLSLLSATLIFLLWRQVVGLVTGKKPALPVALRQFQRFTSKNTGVANPQTTKTGEVLDVQVREIKSRDGHDG